MTRRGYRSASAIQRITADAIVGAYSFKDYRRGETVNTLSTVELLTLVTRKVGDCSIAAVSRFSEGEIRTDSLGKGTEQYPEKLEALNSDSFKGWDHRYE